MSSGVSIRNVIGTNYVANTVTSYNEPLQKYKNLIRNKPKTNKLTVIGTIPRCDFNLRLKQRAN